MFTKSDFLHRKLILGFLVLVLAGLSAGIWLPGRLASVAKASAKAVAKVGTAIGNQAPEFILANLSGNRVALHEVASKNKVTLVNFWGIWCPYCVREIPEFVAFYDKYRNRRVEVLGVDVGDNPGDLPSFIKKNQMSYPVLLDKNQSISSLYRVSGFPTTFFVDGQGKIAASIIGATDIGTLTKQVDTLLAGK